jgi:hypothetical protein
MIWWMSALICNAPIPSSPKGVYSPDNVMVCEYSTSWANYSLSMFSSLNRRANNGAKVVMSSSVSLTSKTITAGVR